MKTHTCPRCGGGIPNDLDRGKYPGAMSRTDNKTEICSGCGVAEAIADWHGELQPQSEWFMRSQPSTVVEEAADGGVR